MKSKTLLYLLCLVFVSRLLFAVVIWKIDGGQAFSSPDTNSYLVPARAMLHGTFASNIRLMPREGPELFRTPGYPLILMPAVALHSLAFAIFENCLLATLIAWVIWRITECFSSDPRARVWAVLLYCIEPLGFMYCEKILSETAFAALFALFVWLMVLFFRRPDSVKLAGAALVLGCATYIRPVSLYQAFWLMPVLLLFPRNASWRQRALGTLLFPAVFLATLAPWVVRNQVVEGYRGFSSSGAFNLYFYGDAALQAKLQHSTLGDEQRKLGYQDYFAVHPEQQEWPQARIIRFWDAESKKDIAGHWRVYAGMQAKGAVEMLFIPGVSELLRDLRLYPMLGSPISEKMNQGILPALRWLIRTYPVAAVAVPLMLVLLLVYYGLALTGLRYVPPEISALFLWLTLYFVLVSGFAANARFRIPFMPLVCIAAGLAIAGRKSRKAVRDSSASRDLGASAAESATQTAN